MKKGFTLAEVLIVLAIVGVVAILTIPNLVAKYKEKMYVAQLQNTLATVESTFRTNMAKEDVSMFGQLAFFKSIPLFCCYGELYQDYTTNYTKANKELKKYFNIAKAFDQPKGGESNFCTRGGGE